MLLGFELFQFFVTNLIEKPCDASLLECVWASLVLDLVSQYAISHTTAISPDHLMMVFAKYIMFFYSILIFDVVQMVRLGVVFFDLFKVQTYALIFWSGTDLSNSLVGSIGGLDFKDLLGQPSNRVIFITRQKVLCTCPMDFYNH